MNRLLCIAARAARHPKTVLFFSALLTAFCAWTLKRLRLDTDLANLLPKNHPELQRLRRIQAAYPSESVFVLLLSRSFHFAVDQDGRAWVHDGYHWSKSKSLASQLNALWGHAIEEVYAAGTTGTILRYDGATWQPQKTESSEDLHGLWGNSDRNSSASSRVVAVGNSGTILQLIDGRWRRMAVPTREDLHCIFGTSNQVFVAGRHGTLLRLAGSEWQLVSAPTRSTIRGIWASQSGAGVELHLVGDRGLWLRRDHQGKWTQLSAGTADNLHAVWGADPNYVVAAGDHGTLLLYNGKHVLRQRIRNRRRDDLRTVFGLGRNRVWAAGNRCQYQRNTYKHDFWWHGPYDSQPATSTSLFRLASCVSGQHRCRANFTAIWRPPSDLSSVLPALDRMARRLARNPSVARVEYKRPIAFFRDRALYFLSLADLRSLRDALRRTLERETARSSGMFVDLDDSAEASGQDEIRNLLAKHSQRVAELTRDPYFREYDGASVGIVVYAKKSAGDLAGLKQLKQQLATTFSKRYLHQIDPHLRADVGGDAVAKIREYEATAADISHLGWAAIAGITLVLLLFCRSIVAVLLVVVPLAMSITWTFALVALTLRTLNVITGFLFAVLFGLGIDYGLQLLARYREQRALQHSPSDALWQTLQGTGRATFTSALTSAAGLATLLLSDFRGFSEFGLIASFGVLFSFLAFILVMPAMIMLGETSGRLKLKPVRGYRETLPVRLPRAVLSLFVAGALVSGYGVQQITFEQNQRALRPPAMADEILDRSKSAFGASFSPTPFLAPSADELRAAIRGLKQQQRRLGSRSTLRKTASILDLVPARQREKRRILSSIKQLLDLPRWRLVKDATKRQIKLDRLRKMAAARPFTLDELPASARRRFFGPGFGDRWIGLAYYNIDISDSRQARRYQREVGNFSGARLLSVPAIVGNKSVAIHGQQLEVDCGANPEACRDRLKSIRDAGRAVFREVYDKGSAVRRGLATGALHGNTLAIVDDAYVPTRRKTISSFTATGPYHATSTELVLAEVANLMQRDGLRALVAALLAVLAVCWIDLRSPWQALLAFSPVAVGLLFTLGAMSLCGQKLNIFNFVVLPALAGVGIDYGVHFVHRFREVGQVGRARGSMYAVILFCACTSVCGFGSMILAHHPGLRSLGILAVIGLAALFLCANYALPAALTLLARSKEGSSTR